MVSKMDGGEDYFCIDSKPIEVCRIARSKRCSMGKKDFRKAPGVGYCASQSMYYYGYKPVSYTHLDVYKRQPQASNRSSP